MLDLSCDILLNLRNRLININIRLLAKIKKYQTSKKGKTFK